MRHVKRRGHLTYANAISSICLFLLLGGSAYAANSALVANSVGTKQIKNHAVTLTKLAPSTVKAFAGRKGPQGATGPRGTPGAPGPQGTAGSQGAAGITGQPGLPGPFPTTLPSGKTLSGAYSIEADTAGTGRYFGNAYTFAFPLSAEPTPHYIPFGAASPSGCPGTYAAPAAAPGQLCVYEATALDLATLRIGDPTTATAPGSGVMGFYLEITSSAPGLTASIGTWAVTAP